MHQVNYNEISKIYDDVRSGDIVLINHFLQEIPGEDGLAILDIGCGTGNTTDIFEKVTRPRVFQIYGLEPSEGMIHKARKKNSRILLVQATAEYIPLEDDSFHFIFMTDVIHHIPDIHKMFAEIQRILKPNGRVCIATQSHQQIAARPIVQFFPGTVRVDQERYPDVDEIILAARAGCLIYLKQESLFENDNVVLGANFFELVQKKGYSMLHLLTEHEYQVGLSQLVDAMQKGPIQARSAGETLVWFTVE